MTNNVIEFKPRKFEEVYECECGCQKFYLLASWKCECSCCGKEMNNIFTTTEPGDGKGT